MGVIANILATILGMVVEILPAIPASSKIIFPWGHTPLRKVVVQDAKISDSQEKINCPMHAFEDIMSSSSSYIGYKNW